jgi:hypothetical protein
MTILAIDPGQAGAFVFLEGAKMHFQNMPLKKDGTKDVDFDAVMELLRPYRARKPVRVFLERVSAFGMGTTAALNYGRGFAALEIAIALTGLPVTYLEPSKWAKVMHEGIAKDLKPKAKSQIAIGRLFPQYLKDIPQSKAGKYHEGVVDALLIAGYGARVSGLEQTVLGRDDF